MAAKSESTLSLRGAKLASGPNLRDVFGEVIKNPFDPETNPNGFVNMGVSENYAMIPEVKAFVNKNLNAGSLDFTYGEGPWGTKRLRTAMAKRMTKTMNALEPLDPEDLLLVSGVTSLCEMLAFTVFDEGDGLLLPRPIYQAFPMDFGLNGKVKSVHTSFDSVDQFAPDAVEKYEQAIVKAESEGVKIRALMLCNPHNPLGMCYPKDTIIELMKLCSKRKIHLLSDEIYAASVYEVADKEAVQFTSVLSFDYSPYISSDLVHVLYGLSKDFAGGGLRLGCMYTKNRELMRAMSAITHFYGAPGPSQEIATLMFEDEHWMDDFLQLSRERLAKSNKFTRTMLDDMGIPYRHGANAGFFLWIDLSKYLPAHSSELKSEWQREEIFVERMLKNQFYLTDGQGLMSEEPGWFRVIFSQDERTIREGLKRLGDMIGVKTPVG